MARFTKETRLRASIDAGVATMLDSGTNDLMPHFIYCSGVFYFTYQSKIIKKMLLKKMQEYGIQSSILTTLIMAREYLMTKEKSKLAVEGKLKNDLEWKRHDGSINDDLDSFVNNFRNSNEMVDEEVWSFFLPKLTKEELKLVEENNGEHMRTYSKNLNADVDVEEMKQSDSKDKYVKSTSVRKTVYLSLESKQALSENFQTYDLYEDFMKNKRRKKF